MRLAQRHGYCRMDNVWLGDLAKCKYDLFFKATLPCGARGQPRLGCTHLPGSTAWCAPASQASSSYTDAQLRWCSSCRAYPATSDWETLPKAAAREAFWDLPVSSCASMAALCGIEIDSDLAPFDVVWTLVTTLLGVSDEEALRIMQKRMAKLDTHESEASDVILSMDQEIGHLGPYEQKEMGAAKTSHNISQAAFKSFDEAWVEKQGCHQWQNKLPTKRGQS